MAQGNSVVLSWPGRLRPRCAPAGSLLPPQRRVFLFVCYRYSSAGKEGEGNEVGGRSTKLGRMWRRAPLRRAVPFGAPSRDFPLPGAAISSIIDIGGRLGQADAMQHAVRNLPPTPQPQQTPVGDDAVGLSVERAAVKSSVAREEAEGDGDGDACLGSGGMATGDEV